MAKRAPAAEKRPGFFSQIRSLFRFTREVYGWLPWAQLAILIGGVLIGLILGFLIGGGAVLSLILWAVTGLMFGILGAMFLMTRLSTKAMYAKIDGMPGASGHVLSTSLGRSWSASDTPVGVNPKTQDAVYRVVGRGGIVIIGEGARGRLTRLVNDERQKAQRVAHGVPVTVLYVGHGDDDVAISDLSKTIKKLPKAIDKATMAAVIRRHGAQVLNVSVRHSPADLTSLLPWAKEEVFSFVLYYKQRTGKAAREEAGAWTRAMIDTALRFGGRYYLPYQLHATRTQFEQAYPEVEALRSLKRDIDPAGRFSNSLWARYL